MDWEAMQAQLDNEYISARRLTTWRPLRWLYAVEYWLWRYR